MRLTAQSSGDAPLDIIVRFGMGQMRVAKPSALFEAQSRLGAPLTEQAAPRILARLYFRSRPGMAWGEARQQAMGPRPSFRAMTEATQAAWVRIAEADAECARGLPDRLLGHLTLLKGECHSFAVDRLEYCPQTAARASRAVMAWLSPVRRRIGAPRMAGPA
jgi:hypothetical protein